VILGQKKKLSMMNQEERVLGDNNFFSKAGQEMLG
jgi:hypothetical protein